MLSLSKYLVSLSGGPPSEHRFDNTLCLMIGAVFAGYTATALHPEFLKEFEHPLIQFLVFYIIGISSYGGNVPPGGWGWGPFKTLWAGPYVFLDAILTVVAFQTLVYITNYYYDYKNQLKPGADPDEDLSERIRL
jgi:hypothetical protein